MILKQWNCKSREKFIFKSSYSESTFLGTVMVPVRYKREIHCKKIILMNLRSYCLKNCHVFKNCITKRESLSEIKDFECSKRKKKKKRSKALFFLSFKLIIMCFNRLLFIVYFHFISNRFQNNNLKNNSSNTYSSSTVIFTFSVSLS